VGVRAYGRCPPDESTQVVLASAVVTRRTISRLFFSFVIAVTILLIVATSVAVLIGLIRGPHEAAQDLEKTIGAYWPLILASVAVLTAGVAAVPREAVAT
jgi:hypothetical protein